MLKFFIFPVLLSVLHYFGGQVYTKLKKKKEFEAKLFSFASGILITFLFLNLLPDMFIGVGHLSFFLYIYVLLGFTIYLLIHEVLYKYERNKKRLYFELKEAHTLVSFCFHFLIGIVLVEIMTFGNLFTEIMIFIPIALHVTFSSLASHHIARTKNYKQDILDRALEILVMISPICGAAFAIYFSLTNVVTFALYGIVGGVMLFMVIREFIPKPKEAQPLYFIVGQLLFLFLTSLKFLL